MAQPEPTPATVLRRGVLCGMGAGALWGLVFLAPRLAPGFSATQMVVGRYLAFGVLSVLLLRGRARTLLAAMPRRVLGWLAGLALLANTLYYALLCLAVREAGIPATALVIGFLPVLVSLAGWRDRGAVRLSLLIPSLVFCVAAAACIGAGLSWQPPGGSVASDRLFGCACAAGALLSWTGFAVGNTCALRRLPAVSAQDWNLLVGLATGLQAVLLLPLAFWPHEAAAHPPGLRGWAGFASISLGVAALASVGGNALWNRMSRLLPIAMAGQMILFETVFAVVYGLLWDRRWPHSGELAALACIAGAVLCAIAAWRDTGDRENGGKP